MQIQAASHMCMVSAHESMHTCNGATAAGNALHAQPILKQRSGGVKLQLAWLSKACSVWDVEVAC